MSVNDSNKAPKVEKKRKYIGFEDSFHMHGLWTNGMRAVSKDGKLVHIGHNDDTSGSSEFVEPISQASSRDAFSHKIIWVESEENLVYLNVKGKPMAPMPGLNYHVELTFNAKSVVHMEKVTKELNKELGTRIISTVVKFAETFIDGEMDNDDAQEYIKELCGDGAVYDFEKNKLTFNHKESDVPDIEINEKDLAEKRLLE